MGHEEEKGPINSDILLQMRANREDCEISTYEAVGQVGFRQAKEEDQFKSGSVNLNA